MRKEVKEFIHNNKEKLEKEFKEYWTWNLSDTVDSYISDDDYDSLEENGETEEDWWLDNNHNCGYHLEWSCAERAFHKLDFKIEDKSEFEEAQGYLIEFLGYSIDFREKHYYKEDDNE